MGKHKIVLCQLQWFRQEKADQHNSKILEKMTSTTARQQTSKHDFKF